MQSSPRIDELRQKFHENPRRYFAPLANEYRKAGDPEQAIAICRAHLAQQPAHMSGHVVYGQALYDAQRTEEARVVFEKALALDPDNVVVLRQLGDIARQRGDSAEARHWYKRALDNEPYDAEIAAYVAELTEPVMETAGAELAPDSEIEETALDTAIAEVAPDAAIAEVALEAQVTEAEVAPDDGPAEIAPDLEIAEVAPVSELVDLPLSSSAMPADLDVPWRKSPVAEASPFVTRTMGELYAKQGYHAAALDVFRQLAVQHPEDRGLIDRIAELSRQAVRRTPAGPRPAEPRELSLAEAPPVAETEGAGDAPAIAPLAIEETDEPEDADAEDADAEDADAEDAAGAAAEPSPVVAADPSEPGAEAPVEDEAPVPDSMPEAVAEPMADGSVDTAAPSAEETPDSGESSESLATTPELAGDGLIDWDDEQEPAEDEDLGLPTATADAGESGKHFTEVELGEGDSWDTDVWAAGFSPEDRLSFGDTEIEQSEEDEESPADEEAVADSLDESLESAGIGVAADSSGDVPGDEEELSAGEPGEPGEPGETQSIEAERADSEVVVGRPPSAEPEVAEMSPSQPPPDVSPHLVAYSPHVPTDARAPESRPQGRTVQQFFAILGAHRPPSPDEAEAARDDMPVAASSSTLPAGAHAFADLFPDASVAAEDTKAAFALIGALAAGRSVSASTPPREQPPRPPRDENAPASPLNSESEEDLRKFREWLDGLAES